jgi:methionine-rich copper-binding protein CopC
VIVALTIATGSAAAHAGYLRSDPPPNAHLTTAPARVVVGFAQKVVVASSGLVLIASDGRTVTDKSQPTVDPTELALPLPSLADGVYTVAWNTISAEDGDPAKGYFAFVLGAVPAPSGPGMTLHAPIQSNVATALTVAPLRPGENTYEVVVSGSSGPIQNVSRVRLRITPTDRDIGQSEIVLPGDGATFHARGLELPFAGSYHVEVQVRRSDTIDDLAFGYDVPVQGPGPSVSPSAVSAASPTASAVGTAAPAIGGTPIETIVIGAVLAAVAVVGATLLLRRRA